MSEVEIHSFEIIRVFKLISVGNYRLNAQRERGDVSYKAPAIHIP